MEMLVCQVERKKKKKEKEEGKKNVSKNLKWLLAGAWGWSCSPGSHLAGAAIWHMGLLPVLNKRWCWEPGFGRVLQLGERRMRAGGC